jgi:hypothetical protein
MSQKRFVEARANFKYIAKFNGVKDFDLVSFKLEEQARKEHQGTAKLGVQIVGATESEVAQGADYGKTEEIEPKLTVMAVGKKLGLCSDFTIFANLAVMSVAWGVSSLDYYLITFFMKYLPGSIYANTAVSSISEIAAYICSGLFFKTLGGKVAFIISFTVAAVGGLCILFFKDEQGLMIALFVLLAKFGISCAFNLVYMQTPLLFPTHLTATAFGICNIFARSLSIPAPILAEAEEPLPMLVYSGSAILGLIATLFIKTDVHYD